MGWLKAIQFGEALCGFIGELTTGDAIQLGTNAVSVDAESLTRLVLKSGDLANRLIRDATGLANEELGKLRPVDALEVLGVAAELNITEELLGKAREVGQRIAATLGIKESQAQAGQA